MPKVIAIIDDEPEMEFVYSLLLEDWTTKNLVSLKFFTDSRVFVNWFKENSPSMVLTDINMPYVSGPEIAQLIKKSTGSIPVYFISGDREIEYRPLMKAIGVERYLTKPLNFDRFLKLIELELALAPVNS